MRSLLVLLTLCFASSVCFAAPSISYTNLGPTCSTGNRTLSGVSIFDATGLPTSGPNVPRIYYRKGTGAWFSQPGTFVSGSSTSSNWEFTIVTSDLGTLGVNDVVQYYVVAQNTATTPALASRPGGAVGTDVNTITTHPSAPASYTIGATLNGTYTVGAGGDYATLQAAISAYSNGCLAGPVVFSLTDASYALTTQQVIANDGASSTNTLTIRPAAGVSASITGPTTSPLFRITGSYVTIDGDNGTGGLSLTISSSGTAIGIFSIGFATTRDVNIQNTTLISASNTNYVVQVSDFSNFTGAGYFRNIHINGNSLQRAVIGINAYISQGGGFGTGVEFKNNDLSTAGSNAIINIGIQLSGADGAVISGNTIGNFNGNNDQDDVGILLGTGTANALVDKNRIDNLMYTGTAGRGGQGIRIASDLTSANIKVTNNFISNISGDGFNSAAYTSEPAGIMTTGTQGGLTIAHNTISLSGNTLNQTGALSAGIYLGGTVTATVVNNIIYNNLGIKTGAATGSFAPYGAIGIFAGSASQVTGITGNDYYVAPTGVGNKYIGLIGATGYTTLAAWQTASGETNAKNVLPVFISPTDLHLVAASNSALDNNGSPSGITTDIDGDARSATNPDPGADEFTGICVAPAIITQPAAAAACPGSSASFSVTVTGSGLSYQWRKGGTNITGATGSSYTIASVAAGDAASYDVVISGTCGSVTSAAVALSLHTAPAITTQPSAQTACPGANVSFTVAATGTGISYQWRKNGTAISGATAATLTLSNITAADAANYDVIVSGTCTPAVTSTAAALQLTSAPTITTQPQSQDVCSGSNASLTVAAAGTGLTYTWTLNAVPVSGANAATLSLTNVTTGGVYTATVTNSCGQSVSSSAATITVNPVTAITTQPQNASVCAGSGASFSVAASGTALGYQWRKNGANISGATAATYSIASTSATDAANYDVVVTGTCGTMTSVTASLSLNSAPAITVQPQSQSACPGGSITFNITATGAGLSYQWRKGGTDITGATGNSYTVSNIGSSDVAGYDVVVSGTCSPTVTSAAATIALNTVNTWLGTASSDWNNAANWCLGIPTATTDITIAAGTPNSPSIGANAQIHNLTVNTGATVTVAAGGRLDVYGNLLINGTMNATSGTIAFMGAAPQTTSGFSAQQLVVNGSDLTLNGNTTATALTLTSGNISLGNYNLVLGGSAAGSVGSHIITNGTGTVTSNNIGAAAVVVPVGPNATSYNPVTISNGGGRNYTVSVAAGVSPAIAQVGRAVNRTWTIVPGAAVSSNVNIVLQFADADANASASTTSVMEAGVYNGSFWNIISGSGVLPTGTPAAREVSIATTQFGPIVLTSPGGLSYPTAVPSVDADVVLVQLRPSVVARNASLHVQLRRAMKLDMVVMDVNGRTMLRTSRSLPAGAGDVALSLGNLAAGTYYLHIVSAKGSSVIPFVKM